MDFVNDMLSSHTTSLELSLALREAGYPQENALFYWVNFENTRSTPLKVAWRLVPADEAHAYTIAPTEELGRKLEGMVGGTNWIELVASPLASELLPNLPDYIDKDGERSFISMKKAQMYPGIEYSCGYHSRNGRGFNAGFCVDDNMADPIAQTYLHLRKASLI